MIRSSIRYSHHVLLTIVVLAIACDSGGAKYLLAPEAPRWSLTCPDGDAECLIRRSITEIGQSCPEMGAFLDELNSNGRISATNLNDPYLYGVSTVYPGYPLDPEGTITINTGHSNWQAELVNTLRHEYGHHAEPHNEDETEIDTYMEECNRVDPD